MSDTDDPDRTQHRLINLPPPAEPPDEMVHVLRLHSAAMLPVRRLGPDGLVIGRADSCDLVLSGSDVSRQHCRLDVLGTDMLAGGEVVVTDLGSTNGTLVGGMRIHGPVALSPGARLNVGAHLLLYERRARRQLEAAEALSRELQRIRRHLLASLPLPLREGPVLAEWYFQPSAALGGNAFGYHELPGGHFNGFLLDVAGQGLEAAMHAMAVAGRLGPDGIQGADADDPAAVMEVLNVAFPMADNGDRVVAAFYWSYDSATRRLGYCAAGHRPVFLLLSDAAEPCRLGHANPALGAVPGTTFTAGHLLVPPGSTLCLCSDGVFPPAADAEAIVPGLLSVPPPMGRTLPQMLHEAVRAAGPPDDDFTAVALTFP